MVGQDKAGQGGVGKILRAKTRHLCIQKMCLSVFFTGTNFPVNTPSLGQGAVCPLRPMLAVIVAVVQGEAVVVVVLLSTSVIYRVFKESHFGKAL